MTVFLGNVIDMLISGSHIVAEPATEFFVYAFMTIIVIGFFILLAIRYDYNNNVEDKDAPMKHIEKSPSGMENSMLSGNSPSQY